MNEILWAAWPWIGFGMGIVLIIQLLFRDNLRSDTNVSRLKDPTWLSWAMAAAYLIHVAEEYGIYFANGQYILIQNFIDTGISAMFGGIPMLFFPFVNIMATWIAFPTAAIISKKHPVIGLSTLGFVLVNGLTHLGALINGGNFMGGITGILIFLPLFIWTVYACSKYSLLPKRGLIIAVSSGVVGHIGLFGLYIINKFCGSMISTACVVVVAFISMIIAWILCRLLNVDDAKKVSA